MWRKLDLSYIASGNVEDFTLLENSLAISGKTKHTITIWPINCTLGHLSQRNENLCVHKNPYNDIYSKFTYNSPKLESAQISSNNYTVYVLAAQSCPTLWDPMYIACQAPLSMGFSRQEYWSRLLFPPLGDLPDQAIYPVSHASAGRFFIVWVTREAQLYSTYIKWNITQK